MQTASPEPQSTPHLPSLAAALTPTEPLSQLARQAGGRTAVSQEGAQRCWQAEIYTGPTGEHKAYLGPAARVGGAEGVRQGGRHALAESPNSAAADGAQSKDLPFQEHS